MQRFVCLVVLVCVCAAATCTAVSTSTLEYKIRQYANAQLEAQMVGAMRAIGVDVANLRVQMRDNGNTLSLNGTVPSQNDLEGIAVVIKQYGPFKNLHNYVKIKPLAAQDGIVVEVDLFRRQPVAADHSTNECAVCALGKDCDDLYKEREALVVKLKPFYVRKLNADYVVFKPEAADLLKRFRELSELLDASSCYMHQEEK
ncbi:MAG: hypothetical protein NTV22_19965 [bacterium]|nr:hypothetical protein [bacterium]